MKKLLLRTGLVLGSLALSVLAVDWWARAFHPFGIQYWSDFGHYVRNAAEPALDPLGFSAAGRIFQHKPDVALHFATFDLFTNDHGLRAGGPGERVESRAVGSEQVEPAAALRILFLGDSVTLGWGVDDANTWVRRVEREGTATGGRPLECLNAGHMKYDTTQEANLLEHLGPDLRPDLVVVMFIVNDVVSSWDDLGLEPASAPGADARGTESTPATTPRGFGGALARWLPGISLLYRFWSISADLERIELRDLPPPPNYPEGWPRCAAALDRMLRSADALGARLVVLDHSMPRFPEVEAWCDSRGVPRIDTSFSDAEWAQPIRNSRVDAHANALGNRMIADKVLAGLRRLELLR